MDVVLNTSWADIVKILVSNDTNFWLIITMLLVAYIGIRKVFGFLCNSKFEEDCKDKSNATKCAKLAKKDYAYLVVIVLIVATFLLSLSLQTNENAMSLFSFASTIASIILSVIAIILTITSETKNESTKEKLEKSVEQIQSTTNLLKEASKTIDPELLKKISDQTDELKDLTKNIDIQTDELKELMKDAKVQIESILKTSEETNKAVTRGPGKVKEENFDNNPIVTRIENNLYDNQDEYMDVVDERG